MKCEQCQLGRCRPQRLPYLSWFGDQIMIVPQAPAYVCDMCKQIYYEPVFLINLEFLLECSGKPSDDPVSNRHTVVEESAEWQRRGSASNRVR